MKRRYCKHVIFGTCMQQRQCMPCQCRERLCAAERLIQSYLSLLVSQTPHSAATPHHHNRRETQLSYPWKLHACRANKNYFVYIFFYFLLSVFVIAFNCIIQTIVTVYTDNIFLYNYLWQIHQIIHLSPVGCFTPARGKTMQKNREVSGVTGIATFTFWSSFFCHLSFFICYRPYFFVVMGSVFLYIIKFIIEMNTVIKLAHK